MNFPESTPPTGGAASRPLDSTPRWVPPSPESLQKLLPQYEVISLLGQGGMAAVYKARQISLDRLVAIKLLPPEVAGDDAQFISRFKNEARLMARLSHPGIVAVHEFGETSDGQLFFVMEHVDGTDVARMIESHGKLPPAQAIAITSRVCEALQFAHSHDVIHRDIKPANILIDARGRVKVADFGLARADDPVFSGLTKTNFTMGTPDFVAPETLLRGSVADHRADLYAVGVMLYQMLTGEIPRGLFKMPAVRDPEIDGRFDAIITKAMQTSLEARYQTATDLQRDLEEIASRPVAAAPPASSSRDTEALPQPVPAGERKGTALMRAVAGILLAVVIAGTFMLLRNPRKPDAPAMGTAGTLGSTDAGQPWSDGLAEWFAQPEGTRGGWLAREAHGARVKERKPVFARPGSPDGIFKDVALRATVRDTVDCTTLSVRQTGGSENPRMYSADFYHHGLVLIRRWEGGSSGVELARIQAPSGFEMHTPHVFDFRAQGDRLSVALDGRELGSARDGTLEDGRICLTADPGALVEGLAYRPLPPADATATSTAADARPWNDALDDWFANAQSGATDLLSKEAGGARVKERRAVYVYSGPVLLKVKDMAVRATVKDTSEFTSLHLRVNGTGESLRNYQAVFYRHGESRIMFIGARPGGEELVRFRAPAGFDSKAGHTFEFQAAGDLLTLRADGREIGSVHHAALAEGLVYFAGDSGTLLEKLEYRIPRAAPSGPGRQTSP